MRIRRYYILFLFLLFGTGALLAQEKCTEICVHFRVNSITIDSAYVDNAVRLHEIRSALQTIRQDSSVELVKVPFYGISSPEGSYQLNRRLAKGRLAALENLVRREMPLPDSLICRNDSCVPWSSLRSLVEQSDMQGRDKVVSILDKEAWPAGPQHDSNAAARRIAYRLKRLSGGKVWKELNSRYFADLRNASVVFVTRRNETPSVPVTVANPDTTVAELSEVPETIILSDTILVTDTVVPTSGAGWIRRLHLKTNAVGWGMAIANVAAEVDLARHWSFTLPIYFSAWDYFKSTIKLRTFAIQPEVRYWLSERNDGFFAGAHFGMAYYNVAFDGAYRYQDYSRETPALGGGVSIGYRLPISDNNRWRLELALGAGVYALHHNKFLNTPDTKDGALMEGSVKKTFIGIDRVAVSFAYTFDLKKKGAGR